MLKCIVLLLALAHGLAGPPFIENFMIDQPVHVAERTEDELGDVPAGDGLYKLSYADYQETWESFKSTFNRVYQNKEEERMRQDIFMDTVKFIENHNWMYHNGNSTFYLGINQFSDLTNEEYHAMNGFGLNRTRTYATPCPNYRPSTRFAPYSIDWRSRGYVTRVKNQKHCGSCWAFGSIGAVEGQWYRSTGKLISLSEQQLVDCSGRYGNFGCRGGWPQNAFKYLIGIGGLESEYVYPYKAKVQTCQFKRRAVVAKIRSCRKVVPQGSEVALKLAVGKIGPVTVCIDASSRTFAQYKGGVYNNPRCSTTRLNHAVLVVGYGRLRGQDYWIVKNSWAQTWGNKGYILMSRNRKNQCGIATRASFPLV